MTMHIKLEQLSQYLALKLIKMRKLTFSSILFAGIVLLGCNSNKESASAEASAPASETQVGQSGVKDDVSNPNIVQVAVASKDHSSLVAAVKAASLVDALSNAGPFTVFAPTNAAFQKLPAGTVDGLMKPEKKADLENILGYHTYVGVLNDVLLQDGAEFDMVYGGKVKITKQGNKILVNGSPIAGTVKASNGIIHVIDDVLLPK